MSNYVTLMGAEAVQSAGYTIKSAAEDMRQAATNMSQVASDMQREFENFLTSFRDILESQSNVENKPSRKVLAKIWSADKKEYDLVYGLFIRWGNDEDNTTIAIIELENGKVVITLPNNVTFV